MYSGLFRIFDTRTNEQHFAGTLLFYPGHVFVNKFDAIQNIALVLRL